LADSISNADDAAYLRLNLRLRVELELRDVIGRRLREVSPLEKPGAGGFSASMNATKRR
jgi:hypothetical protein